MDITEPQTISPCINVCEIDCNNICIGCYRSIEEIGKWSTSNASEKIIINAIAVKRKESYKTNFKKTT